MAKVTAKELVDFAHSKLGTPYVYGSKGGVLTNDQINCWAKMYPGIFTTRYINLSKKYIGKRCTDCSGLISWCTGVLLGSGGLYADAKERHPISTIDKAPIGAILWRKGHVAVYIGKGECIEAKGIEWGTIKSKVSSCGFTHWLLMDYIDYSVKDTNSKPEKPTIPSKLKSEKVKELQAEFNRIALKDVNLIKEDGIPGPKTLGAAPTIKDGDKGAVVKLLQEILSERGFHKFKPSGKYGAGTRAAIKRFQKFNKLKETGIFGQAEWKALFNI